MLPNLARSALFLRYIYLVACRSHKHLLELPSRLFYREALLPFANEELVQPPDWNELQHDPIVSQEDGLTANMDGVAANMLFFGVRGKQVLQVLFLPAHKVESDY